ncbi:hypothetical protein [Streptomyces sp. NBC_01304]|uniref:hypothetical protein n=1 Tax=Streptomyces sp. NBC_01304 TaxID=2903818 RepID=UPI002E1051ED|nr:hypothetical protein OG430_10760 [Streptomyces sp. NBC_01304]
MSKVVWLDESGWRSRPQPGGEPLLRILVDEEDLRTHPDGAAPLAYLERALPPGGVAAYKQARKQGVRTFALWFDAHRGQPFAYVTTKSAAKGASATYEVLGASGEPVALIGREPALRGAVRTRWTVQQAGQAPFAGRKGNPFWWCVWWLISPVQLAIGVAAMIGGDGDVARMPRRTKWRRNGRVALDWQSGGSGFRLHVHDEQLDPRAIAALVALVRSHDGALGHAWDKLP